MNEFLQNLENSLCSNIPILTLIGAFAALDIIAALDSEDGLATSSKFKKWFEKYLPQYTKMVTSNDYHNFRCGLLHQLTGGRIEDSFHSLAFYLKDCQIQAHLTITSENKEKYLFINLEKFVEDVVYAIRKCIGESLYYEKHKESVITLHPNGIPALNWMGVINGKPPSVITSAKRGSSPNKDKKCKSHLNTSFNR